MESTKINFEQFCKLLRCIVQDEDAFTCQVKQDGNNVEVVIDYEPSFDDSAIKEMAKGFKEAIKVLDDNLFIESVEDFKENINLNRFNELLDLEEFDEDQAQEVERMINTASEVICSHIQKKIKDLVDLYEKF